MLALILANFLISSVVTVPWETRGALQDGGRIYVWGDKLAILNASSQKLGTVTTFPDGFSEGGCMFDVDGDGRSELILQLGRPLGKLVWLKAPFRTVGGVLDTGIDMHDCVSATLFGRRGLLMIQRGIQLRFYQPPSAGSTDWPMQEVYSIYTPSYQTGLVVADVNGNGVPDILCGNYFVESPDAFELPWHVFAINLWFEDQDSGSMRLAFDGKTLLTAQGHVGDGARIGLFRPGPDVHQQWQRIAYWDTLKKPHAIAALDDGTYVVGENNGPASRLAVLKPNGEIFTESAGGPLHTLFSNGNQLIGVGPGRIVRYRRK